jgi:hypothetical protein
MKDLINRLRRLGTGVVTSQADWALERSCAGRIISALTFIVVIICLGLWITAFLLLKDRLFTETLSGNILTNLTCLTFFGGLVVAIFVGALAGNFLRRTIWKILIKRKK